jgi:pectate lyase
MRILRPLYNSSKPLLTLTALLLGACAFDTSEGEADAEPFGSSSEAATSCTAPAAPALVGWAAVNGAGVAKTTGGGSAAPVTVTTFADLQKQVSGSTAKVVYVKGSLGPGKLSVGSNKTIVGLCGAEIKGNVKLSGAVNVVIRNIKITGYAVGNCALDPDFDGSVGCSSGNDAIEVHGSHHVWLDHLAVSDGTDGNLDINSGSDYVTVSWSKFSYAPRTDNVGDDRTGAAGHRFSSLIGGSDSKTSDRTHLNVTWHHDYWADNVVERQARVRFGKNHFFNNLWASKTTNYCVRAGKEASIHLENDYFEGQKNPHQFNSTTDQGTAYISTAGNTYASTSGTQATGGGGTKFTPANYYSYASVMTSAAQARTDVLAGVGPH